MNPNMTLLLDESSQLSHQVVVVATTQAEQWHRHGCLQFFWTEQREKRGNCEKLNPRKVNGPSGGWVTGCGPASHKLTGAELDCLLKGLTESHHHIKLIPSKVVTITEFLTSTQYQHRKTKHKDEKVESTQNIIFFYFCLWYSWKGCPGECPVQEPQSCVSAFCRWHVSAGFFGLCPPPGIQEVCSQVVGQYLQVWVHGSRPEKHRLSPLGWAMNPRPKQRSFKFKVLCTSDGNEFPPKDSLTQLCGSSE